MQNHHNVFSTSLNLIFFPFAFSLSLLPFIASSLPSFQSIKHSPDKVVNTRQRGMSHSSKTASPQSSEKVHNTFYILWSYYCLWSTVFLPLTPLCLSFTSNAISFIISPLSTPFIKTHLLTEHSST